MAHRTAQVESALKRAIGAVLAARLSDPRIEGLVSITRVRVSPDLHDAQVYVSVLPAKHQTRTLYGLQHAAAHIHSRVCELVDMKKVPHLDFRGDESIKKQAVVDAAIQKGLDRDRRGGARTRTHKGEASSP